jgi:hypothetical protein
VWVELWVGATTNTLQVLAFWESCFLHLLTKLARVHQQPFNFVDEATDG